MTWDHDDLARDLAAHIREKSGRIVWTDMQLGPQGSPRPDAYALETSFTKFRPHAYEVKISVSDFRRDVTAGKWQSYLRYAAGVTFAVPAGLIGKDDVPAGCGLIVRGPDGWRTAKAATLRPIENLPRDAWLKLVMDGMKREAERAANATRPEIQNAWQMRRRIGQQLGPEVAQLLNDREIARSHYERATAKLAQEAQDAEALYESRMKKVRERVDSESGQIDQARAEMAKALGLPANASVWTIQSAARAAAARFDENAEIARLRAHMAAVETAMREFQQRPAILSQQVSA